jgi:hypothetical protein
LKELELEPAVCLVERLVMGLDPTFVLDPDNCMVRWSLPIPNSNELEETKEATQTSRITSDKQQTTLK